jgi:hypothetical protein
VRNVIGWVHERGGVMCTCCAMREGVVRLCCVSVMRQIIVDIDGVRCVVSMLCDYR